MNVHTIFTGVANTHIIETSHGVIIVDAGMPHQARRILGKVRALGHSEKDLRLIFVTHGHIDHAGSAVALKRLTGAPIALHRDDMPLVATPSLKIPPGRNRFIQFTKHVMDTFSWIAPLETFAPDVILDDGQSLREFGLDARVVHTPGHTAGSVTIACDDGTAFVGDAILNLVRISFPLYWDDPATAFDSAHKIRALDSRVLYSGHGRPFSAAELDEFVARRMRRES